MSQSCNVALYRIGTEIPLHSERVCDRQRSDGATDRFRYMGLKAFRSLGSIELACSVIVGGGGIQHNTGVRLGINGVEGHVKLLPDRLFVDHSPNAFQLFKRGTEAIYEAVILQPIAHICKKPLVAQTVLTHKGADDLDASLGWDQFGEIDYLIK